MRPPGRAGWLLGVYAVVVFLVATPFGLAEPGPRAPLREVVAYWSEHSSLQSVLSVAFATSGAALVGFGATLREVLQRAERGAGATGSIVLGGTVIAGAGLLVTAGLTFAAADTAGHVEPAVTQTLSVLAGDLFFPIAGGFALMLAGTGLTVIRTSLLPPWFGWLSVVVAVTALTPAGFVAYLLVPFWILFVCARFGLGQAHAAAGSAT